MKKRKRTLFIFLLSQVAVLCMFAQQETSEVTIFPSAGPEMWKNAMAMLLFSELLIEVINNTKVLACLFAAVNALPLFSSVTAESYILFFLPVSLTLLYLSVTRENRFPDGTKYIVPAYKMLMPAIAAAGLVFIIIRLFKNGLTGFQFCLRIPFVIILLDLVFLLLPATKKYARFDKYTTAVWAVLFAEMTVFYLLYMPDNERTFDIYVSFPSAVLWSFCCFKTRAEEESEPEPLAAE
ncbi:MAG: hypothetical protein II702_00410 [Clostridia bacterium]|nr:hypothetical protein [Clostridia bacterium]